MISECELHWLAGILEGEGYFGYKTSQDVKIQMTDEDIMIKVASLMGEIAGRRITLKEKIYNKEHGMSYSIEISGNSARKVMHAVVRLMGQRRRKKIWQSLNGFKQKTLKIDMTKLRGRISETMGTA